MAWLYQTLRARIDINDKRLTEITASLKAHDKNVEEKHVENKRDIGEIRKEVTEVKATVGRIEGGMNTFNDLLPAIKQSVEIDQRSIYRKKLFRTVWRSVVSTIFFLGAVATILQYAAGWPIFWNTLGHLGMKGGTGGH